MIHTEITILGSEFAGYVGAIKAAQLQVNNIILIEKGQVGGTCLNRRCIPTKVLVESLC